MNERFCQDFVILLVICNLALAGCSSGPTAIRPVDIDADQAGDQAIEFYDKDGDGTLNVDELAAVPGVLKYLDKYDQNADGLVSGDEITERVELWDDQAMGIRTLDVEVTIGARPLQGAEVRFVPESYLGDGPKVASGTTDSKGFAKISVAVDELPDDLRKARMRGLFGGTYKIEVTHPTLKVPATYNTETTLGEEVARDTIGDWLVLKLDKD
ncbi:EF-hand domain-containing protein [Bythopirellula goksoeyrii]|nr:hypothetical protein [Bythopirellula goksoeyrii]